MKTKTIADSGWGQAPAAPIPPIPEGEDERAWHLEILALRAKRLALAIKVSTKASEQRRLLDAGSSRARITSANAKWSRAAEDRDRKEQDFLVAIEACACGFNRVALKKEGRE